MQITKWRLSNNSLSIFLNSVLILLLELILIRYIPSYVVNFNYYTNFVLFAAFLGMGLGLILGTKKNNLTQYFPILLLIFLLSISLTRIGTQTNAGDIILLQRDLGYYNLPQWFIVGVIFLFVTALLTTLSHNLGKLLSKSKDPNLDYSFNLVGSLIGIVLFFGLSYLNTSAPIWFGLFIILFLVFIKFASIKLSKISYLCLIGSLVVVIFINRTVVNLWSPYYRINITKSYDNPSNQKQHYQLFVNDIGHQNLVEPKFKEFIYYSQYRYLNKKYNDALIIGAGAGNDIAIALENGVKHIDAVEIDPTIVKIGRSYHPNQPYSNKNVSVYVDDGRSFLSKSSKKYDMIIFALPDSLIQVSQQGALRLESYLLTKEAFASAKEHLNKGGILVLYNYYWRDWLVDKISAMLLDVFQKEPYVITANRFHLTSYIISNDSLVLNPGAPANMYRKDVSSVSATDNWPFIYLKKNYLPSNYLLACLTIFIVSIALVFLILRKKIRQLSWPLFFTGASFMLLETIALSRFMLLFGTTWIVNSVVFFSILTLCLISNIFVRLRTPKTVILSFILLVFSLLILYFFPQSLLLQFSAVQKYLFGSVLLTGPILFAGVLFSTLFKKQHSYHIALASNLLGAIFGGLCEYLALITGYQFLIIVIILFYTLAIIANKFQK